MLTTITLLPGITTAGANIPIPSNKAEFHSLEGAVLTLMASATNTGSFTDLTVVESAPTVGQIQLTNKNTIVLGDSTIALNQLELTGIALGSKLIA